MGRQHHILLILRLTLTMVLSAFFSCSSDHDAGITGEWTGRMLITDAVCDGPYNKDVIFWHEVEARSDLLYLSNHNRFLVFTGKAYPGGFYVSSTNLNWKDCDTFGSYQYTINGGHAGVIHIIDVKCSNGYKCYLQYKGEAEKR